MQTMMEDTATQMAEEKRVRKRRRLIISCTECHRRKQKCDRDLPCSNCVSRQKESACRYETGAPTAKERGKTSLEDGMEDGVHDTIDAPSATHHPYSSHSLSNAAANWGYSQAGGSTMGLLKKIERANGDAGLSPTTATALEGEQFAIKERYKSLIRQLPAKSYIHKLVDVYIREFNPQYYALDPDVFYRALDEWNNLSFNVLSSSGPQALSPDMRVFPALLFQVLATALLILTDEPHEFYDHLKYAGNMTFGDLSADYSESGVAILNLLGKRQMSLTGVLAAFLRANLLKYLGKVTEAWHAIGGTVKDAQEIGMHRDSLDPEPASNSVEDILENMWLIQRRRRIYMVLMMWDLHCGVVLGRPGSIDWRAPPPSMPIDAPLPRDRRKTPVIPRNEDLDPPTPVTKQIAVFNLIQPLVKVMELERDGPCPKVYDKVDEVQRMALHLNEQIPAYFRLENPDQKWDDHPDSWWLQSARYYLPQLHYFNLIALHRSYVFHRQRSRTEALRASIGMLQWQMETFRGLDPKSWRNFHLFFGSFDAVVLMAAIFVLFPKEHPELARDAMQEFQWTLERFDAMQERNKLAKAAKGVLQVIYLKFRKAIEGQAPPRSLSSFSSVNTTSTSSRDTAATESPTLHTPIMHNGGSAQYMPMITGSAMGPPMQPVPMKTESLAVSYPAPSATNWAMPANFDFANYVPPLNAMGEIAYHDLNILSDGSIPWGASVQPALEAFEGDFGDSSFWSLMNQYDPGPI